MKLKVTEFAISIHPESAQDVIYIKHLLGLEKEGDRCVCLLQHSNTGEDYIDIRGVNHD